jgi:hypothetical protein
MSRFGRSQQKDIDLTEQTLTTIAQLQNVEKNLYLQLETSTSVAGNTGNYEDLIEKINDVAATRTALFNSLANIYERAQENVSNSRISLVDQITMANMVEQELNATKQQMNDLDSVRINKLRMVDINMYYGKKYNAKTGVMKLTILFCIPILVVAILKKMSLLPETLSMYLIGIILAFAIYFLSRRIWDIYVRSNMNFDEYNFMKEPDYLHPTIMEYNRANFPKIGNVFKNIIGAVGIDCFGSDCCAMGMTYDTESRQCRLEPFLTGTGKKNVRGYSKENKYMSI